MQLPDDSRARWARRNPWALALGIFSVALALRLLLLPVQAGLAYLTFYPAVVLTFYRCGVCQGWLVVALAALAGTLCSHHPTGPSASTRWGWWVWRCLSPRRR